MNPTRKNLALIAAIVVLVWLVAIIIFLKVFPIPRIIIDGATYRSESYEDFERVKFLVLHYSALDLNDTITTFIGQNYSVHYVVPKHHPFHIYQLVDDTDVAYHAGASYWRGYSHLNSRSIGIEIVNLGYNNESWDPFPEKQINAVIALSQLIVQKYQIAPIFVVGHSDIAPGRRVDPGPLFPWKRLYDNGVGAWYDQETFENFLPEVDTNDIITIQRKFRSYGYDMKVSGGVDEQTRRVVKSFQMHFRPANYSGIIDRETVAILNALLYKYLQKI